jgi:hypothetical protein
MSEHMVKNTDFVMKKYAEAYAKTFKKSRGQGGTFGYDLITGIATSLSAFTDELDPCDVKAVKLINAYQNAMRMAFMEDSTGDGGEIGKAISQSLELAIHKISANPVRSSLSTNTPQSVASPSAGLIR